MFCLHLHHTLFSHSRRDVTCTHPGMLGSGTCKFDMFDDGLSYTSTEFEKDDGVLGGPPPSALQNREMLINLNMNGELIFLLVFINYLPLKFSKPNAHRRNKTFIFERYPSYRFIQVGGGLGRFTVRLWKKFSFSRSFV